VSEQLPTFRTSGKGGAGVEDFLRSWGYLGIFLGIVATGLGFPMPEELPVVVGGAVAGGGAAIWWLMLPACIVGVIVGDSCLYFIGWFWGPRLLQSAWVQRHLLSAERVQRIEKNFQEYGVRILLFARLTPGIRAPIFLTAGLIRLSLGRFVLADAIYAVPGVSLLFFLGYWFTDRMVAIVEQDVERVKSIIILVVVVAIAGYVLYRFLRRPMVTGAPEEMPPLVGQVTNKLDEVTSKIINPPRPPSQPSVDLDAGDAGPAPDRGAVEEGQRPRP
jgi:membrane protein DedA with SNARE-associated domain